MRTSVWGGRGGGGPKGARVVRDNPASVDKKKVDGNKSAFVLPNPTLSRLYLELPEKRGGSSLRERGIARIPALESIHVKIGGLRNTYNYQDRVAGNVWLVAKELRLPM